VILKTHGNNFFLKSYKKKKKSHRRIPKLKFLSLTKNRDIKSISTRKLSQIVEVVQVPHT